MTLITKHPDASPSRKVPAILLTTLLALIGCRDQEQPAQRFPGAPSGPIVLITIDTLRADVVGALANDHTPADQRALTPNLDRFAEESQWVSRAVATSSWTVPSMASIMTGLQPWAHGNWHGERVVLADELHTLAEAMQEAGFSTYGFRSNTWLRPKFGYAQGFDEWYDLGGSKRAQALLRSLGEVGEEGHDADARPAFVWIHVLPPHAPYLRHDEFLDRLGSGEDAPSEERQGDEAWTDLPARVTASELEPYLDPNRQPSATQLRDFWALYRLHVSHADRIVGGLLDALRESPAWADATVAITSDHGEEFAEAGQIAHGGNLHRVLLEVPLLVRFPEVLRQRSGYSLTPRAGVSNARLYATLAEVAGAGDATLTHVLPSLFVDQPPAALSELYLGNGDNRFSLVTPSPAGSGGLVQMHWTSQFSAPEGEYFAARIASVAGHALPSGEDPEALFARQADAFLVTPPLLGDPEVGRPQIEVRPWSGTEPEVALLAVGSSEVAALLRGTWTERNGEDIAPAEFAGPQSGRVELTAAERERLERLGYVVR